jgi:hypothetical protein
MSTERDDFVKNLKNLIKNNSITLNRIEKKEVISTEDQKVIDSIKTKTVEILTKTHAIKNLPVDVINDLNDVKFRVINDHSVAFSYTPTENQEGSQLKNYTTISEDLLIAKHDQVVGGKAIGATKKTLGIIDDLSQYDGKPTIFLGKSKSGNSEIFDGTLHDIKIDDEYKISFDFRLNRFPSKVYQDTKKYEYSNNNAMIARRYTSRRSDLMTFNYGEEGTQNTIKFGAMAPYLINSNGSNVFDNCYDDFSIAACINYNKNQKISVFTDYKFKLGETYNVMLKIKLITKDYLKGLMESVADFKALNGVVRIPKETFIYDDLEYNEEFAQNQIKRWSQILQASDRKYSTYAKNLDVIKSRYEDALLNGQESFIGLDGNNSYSLESGRKKIMWINEFLNNQNAFGGRAPYDISITVNGKREDIDITDNKVWGASAKSQKMLGNLPSGPGFTKLGPVREKIAGDRNKDMEATTVLYYDTKITKFPKYIDDIINSEINRQIREQKKLNQPGVKDPGGVVAAPKEKLDELEQEVIKMQWFKVIDQALKKEGKHSVQFTNIRNTLNYVDLIRIIDSYGEAIQTNRRSDSLSPVKWNYTLQEGLEIEDAYIDTKALKKLGIESKIVSKDESSVYYDPKDLYDFNIRIINVIDQNKSTIEQISSIYSEYSSINPEIEKKLSELPANFTMQLTFADALQLKKDIEKLRLAGVVIKPKLKGGSLRIPFTNNLQPHKVCVPIHSILSDEIDGILPFHIITDKPREAKRKAAAVAAVAAVAAARIDLAEAVAVSADGSSPTKSQTIILDKVDLTKLYSIYSTPYIIKKQ